jgi:IS4 transposase
MSVDEKHIRRVTDAKASELYHEGGWRYVSKSLWKEKVRDVNKPTEEETTTKTKSNKMSRAAKRHLRKSSK